MVSPTNLNNYYIEDFIKPKDFVFIKWYKHHLYFKTSNRSNCGIYQLRDIDYDDERFWLCYSYWWIFNDVEQMLKATPKNMLLYKL